MIKLAARHRKATKILIPEIPKHNWQKKVEQLAEALHNSFFLSLSLSVNSLSINNSLICTFLISKTYLSLSFEPCSSLISISSIAVLDFWNSPLKTKLSEPGFLKFSSWYKRSLGYPLILDWGCGAPMLISISSNGYC
jgi:hypothetical protein